MVENESVSHQMNTQENTVDTSFNVQSLSENVSKGFIGNRFEK